MERYYSPRIDRDLVSALYYAAKARRTTMTKLASQLIRAALRYEGILDAEDVMRFSRPLEATSLQCRSRHMTA